MFGILLLSVLLIGDAKGSWDEEEDITDGNAEFLLKTLVCNDAGSVCVFCSNMTLYDVVDIYVFEYTTEPVKFQITFMGGRWNYKFQHIQGDPSESFRYCDNAESIGDTSPVGPPRSDFKAIVCIDNYFAGMSLPDTCTKPVALVSVDKCLDNRKHQGNQILYCLP